MDPGTECRNGDLCLWRPSLEAGGFRCKLGFIFGGQIGGA